MLQSRSVDDAIVAKSSAPTHARVLAPKTEKAAEAFVRPAASRI
jgi:hypothetical protein